MGAWGSHCGRVALPIGMVEWAHDAPTLGPCKTWTPCKTSDPRLGWKNRYKRDLDTIKANLVEMHEVKAQNLTERKEELEEERTRGRKKENAKGWKNGRKKMKKRGG